MGNKTSPRVPPQPYKHFDTQIAYGVGNKADEQGTKKELIP